MMMAMMKKRCTTTTLHSQNLLSWLSSVMLLAHYVVGTLIFSSFLFIGTSSASYILCRFVGSAFVCRLLLWLEHDSLCMQFQHKHNRHGQEDSIDLGPLQPLTAHEQNQKPSGELA